LGVSKSCVDFHPYRSHFALAATYNAFDCTLPAQARKRPEYQHLLSAPGIGKILALTIPLETGDIGRFPGPGHYASYCRCVASARISNSKSKGKGNNKNGNKYLAWAFVEAANFATRFNGRIKGYYQRKLRNTHPVLARKTVAHKMARACFDMMRDRLDFDIDKAFG
jgi:transposase